jgi:hypothetical protein
MWIQGLDPEQRINRQSAKFNISSASIPTTSQLKLLVAKHQLWCEETQAKNEDH